jgi:hypothetical protein
MNQSNIIQIIAFLLLFAQGCKANSKDDPKKSVNKEQGNVIRRTSVDLTGSIFLKEKRIIEKKLGLNSIENGFEDLQIRIWKGFSQTDYLQLKVFSNNGKTWSAQLYNLVLHYDKNFDSVVAVTNEVVTKTPRTGWKFFTDSLFKLDILNLPDDSKIPNYNISSDSDLLTVEIAKGNSYRFYSYADIETLSKSIEEARKMEQILKLIQDEF